MLFVFSFFSLELAVIVICLLFLVAGLARITTKRQMEVLKDYLQPEVLPIEQLIMRAEKASASQSPNALDSDSPENDRPIDEVINKND